MDVRAHAVSGGLASHRIGVRGGPGATLAWGFTTIGTFAEWAIARDEAGAVRLTGTLATRSPEFFFRQRPLLFTVPRPGGFFVYPVRTLTVGTAMVVATLGPMEA